MMIESVRLHRFRNYEDQKISFPKATILLYGQNGQGKTNLLESLYLGGIGKSYRGIADSDLISWDQDKASVIIDFNRNDTTQQIKVILSKLEKKELWVNETKVSQKELIGTLNEVLFSPDDLQLIKAVPLCGAVLSIWRSLRSADPITAICCSIIEPYHSATSY